MAALVGLDEEVLGDKAYRNATLQGCLRHPCVGTRNAVDLLAPTKANARAPMPAPLVRLIAHVRQAIETLNSQLAGQCNVERNRATCPSGLRARVQPSSPSTPSTSPAGPSPSSSTIGY